jgi:hypothetical protein
VSVSTVASTGVPRGITASVPCLNSANVPTPGINTRGLAWPSNAAVRRSLNDRAVHVQSIDMKNSPGRAAPESRPIHLHDASGGRRALGRGDDAVENDVLV